MSGTRHHVVPRFLLRGFASNTTGTESYSWVFPAKQKPFKANIKNIAVEGHFYTHDDQTNIDDSITRLEGELSDTVRKLREQREIGSIQSNSIAILIAHLESRTRHLRVNFEFIAETVFEQMLAFIQNKESFSKFLITHLKRDPSIIISPLKSNLRRQGIPNAKAELLLATLKPSMETIIAAIAPKISEDFSNSLRRTLLEEPDFLKVSARNGQLQALEKSIAPELKVDQYEGLKYRVIPSSEMLPLGDSAIIFEVESHRRYTTFLTKDDKLIAIYLPLSTELVLCGSSFDFQPDINDLSSTIARCSLDYFVAPNDSAHFRLLQPLISERSTIIDEATIETLFREAFQ